MDHRPLSGGIEASVPSLSVLRRPLPDEGALFLGRRGRNEDLIADLVNSLGLAEDDGGERAEEGAIAEALVRAVIFQSMAFRMFHAEKGRVPKFLSRLAKSVQSFERQLG